MKKKWYTNCSRKTTEKKGRTVGKPYSNDLREKAVNLLEKGMGAKEVAELLSIGIVTAYRWKNRKKKTGSAGIQEKWQKGCNHAFKNVEEFENFLEENKGLTTKELAEKKGSTPKTIRVWYKKAGYTVKKNRLIILKEMKKKEQYFWTNCKMKTVMNSYI